MENETVIEWDFNATVLGRKAGDIGDWQKLGRTPGQVKVPAGFELGAEVSRDNNLAALARVMAPSRRLRHVGARDSTDAGLAHLRPLTDLTGLNLNWCYQITDAGLAHLRPLANLTSLNLYNCGGITDAGVAALERPGLEIIRH